MIATTTHIETPPDWESTGDWDSHRAALYLALSKAKKDEGFIVELGCGFGSSPLMQKYCDENGLFFLSYETNKEWAAKFEMVRCVPSYEYACMQNLAMMKVNLIFIDLAPASERKTAIEHFKDKAKTIVVHDSEPGAEYVYGMAAILSSFKYRIDFKPTGKPHTTIVSDFVNVSKWI
jgi:hypothetical protein